MKQLSLKLLPARARRTDPSTSHEAAAKVNNESVREKVLGMLKVAWILEHDGLTTFELAEKLDMGRDFVSPVMRPLEKLGRIRRATYERVNPKTNCESIVWLFNEEIKNDDSKIDITVN